MAVTAPSTAPAAPACTCRVCGQVMEAKYQAGYETRPGHFLVTYCNPACWMLLYTFADRTYPLIDLAAYKPAAAR